MILKIGTLSNILQTARNYESKLLQLKKPMVIDRE